MKLSILVPTIRDYNWGNMYKSIERSFSGEWELILITSKQPIAELIDKLNIKYIYSNRAPMQKQQEGLCQACGDYIIGISDDHLWGKGTLDKTFELAKDLDYKTFIVMKYLEGKEFDFPGWYLEQVPEDHRPFLLRS